MALNQYSTSGSGPSGGSSFDWTTLANNLGPALIGGAGTYLSGNQLQNSTNKAVGYAGYKPTTITSPGGSITPTRNPDGSISYSVGGGAGSSALPGLGALAGNAAGAGSDVLSAFKNFNPQQFAQQNYNQMAALQAPKNTDQTQQMLNYEQASGRGGLTQNGQLGDLGGLALAQHLGDTNLRMQAEQLASQRQSQLAQTAGSLGQTSTGALGGVSNYNNSLMDMLRAAMGGAQGQAIAGNNQAQLIDQTGRDRANQTGNLFGSTLQGLAASGGGLGTAGSNIFNLLKNSFGGGSSSGGAAMPDPYQYGFTPSDATGQIEMPSMSDQTPPPPTDYGDGSGYGDSTGPFSSAGGEAAGQVASNPQSTDNSSYAGYTTVGNGSGSPDVNVSGALGGAGNVISGLSRGGVGGDLQAASGAGKIGGAFGSGTAGTTGSLFGNLGGIYNGVQRGGVLGYGGAGLSAAGAANNITKLATGNPLYSPTSGLGAGLGLAGNVLGVVNGIKQGGVMGYGSAALNGYQGFNAATNLYNALNAGSAASSAGTGAGASAAGLAGMGLAGSIATGAGLLAPAIMMQMGNQAMDDHWYTDQGGNVLGALGVNEGGNVNSQATNGQTAAQMLAQQKAVSGVLGNSTGSNLTQAQLDAFRKLGGSTANLTGIADPSKIALQGLGQTQVTGNFANYTDDQIRALANYLNGSGQGQNGTGH